MDPHPERAFSLSLIIPTYNEAGTLGGLLQHLLAATAGLPAEIIVVDGGSPDGTLAVAGGFAVRAVAAPHKGRGAQLNHGAALATGTVLYFLHADSVPPAGFVAQIRAAVDSGVAAGCFRLRFDHRHWFLQANAWFTRFDSDWVRFGDQSLFATRAVFEKAGGFREDWLVMEDQEIVPKLKCHGRFSVLPQQVTTSARKYLANGVVRLQLVFFVIWLQWKWGCPQETLVRTYRRLIRQGKV